MWYDNRIEAEQEPLKYIGVWYLAGDIDGKPIGFQTCEDHPIDNECLLTYISKRMLGRMANTEQERIQEAKKYVDLYLDIVAYRMEMDENN